MGIKQKIKDFRWGNILLGILGAVIGTCLFVYNNTSLVWLAITIGIIVTISAIVLCAIAFSDRSRGFAFGMRVALSVALLVTGIVTIIVTDSTIDVLVGVFGLVIIMDGAYKFQTAAINRKYHAAMWWVLLALSVLLIGGGYATVRYLTIQYSATVYLLGALFAIDSVANFVTAFSKAT